MQYIKERVKQISESLVCKSSKVGSTVSNPRDTCDVLDKLSQTKEIHVTSLINCLKPKAYMWRPW